MAKKPGYGVKTKIESQTAKANIAPRLGQRTKNPYQRYLQSQAVAFGLQSPSYNIGRTRRAG